MNQDNINNKAENKEKDSVEEAFVQRSKPFAMEKFIGKNKKQFIYLLGGILVLIVGGIAYYTQIMLPKEDKAKELIVRAQIHFERDSFNLALNGDGTENGYGLLEIADDYGSTETGKLAKLYIGLIYIKQNKFEEAIDYLEDYSSKNNLANALGMAALGDCYVQLKDYEQAASLFMKAGKTADNNFTAPKYLKKAGLTYEQLEDTDKALEAYQLIKDKYPSSIEGAEVVKYIARVKASAGLADN
jgi:tetratricopeptide (TPR) repeat protein